MKNFKLVMGLLLLLGAVFAATSTVWAGDPPPECEPPFCTVK